MIDGSEGHVSTLSGMVINFKLTLENSDSSWCTSVAAGVDSYYYVLFCVRVTCLFIQGLMQLLYKIQSAACSLPVLQRLHNYAFSVLPRKLLRLSWWALFGAEFVTTSIDFYLTSKLTSSEGAWAEHCAFLCFKAT